MFVGRGVQVSCACEERKVKQTPNNADARRSAAAHRWEMRCGIISWFGLTFILFLSGRHALNSREPLPLGSVVAVYPLQRRRAENLTKNLRARGARWRGRNGWGRWWGRCRGRGWGRGKG